MARKKRIQESDSKAIIEYPKCSSDDSQPIVLFGLEGCGNFEPSQVIEGGLVCQSCGCHRNFHKKAKTIVSPENDLKEKGIIEDVGRIKKTRSKFTKDQKEQMEAFANYRLGWKVQGHSKDEISQFCSAIGVTNRAFQVWMSNKRSKMKAKKASS